MLLRNYSPGDFRQLVTLLRECGLFYEYIHRKSVIDKKIKHDPESVIVAEDNGKIVGTVTFIFDPWQSFIYSLSVAPEYRNKKIGSKLMDEAERRLKERGVNIANIFISEGNDAVINFYKKRGWCVWGKCTNMEKKLR